MPCESTDRWVIEAMTTTQAPGWVKHFTAPLLFFDNSTDTMQSGAPVLEGNPADGRIIGIHAQGCHQLDTGTQNCAKDDPTPHGSWNHGTWVTREVFQNMQAWRNVKVP